MQGLELLRDAGCYSDPMLALLCLGALLAAPSSLDLRITQQGTTLSQTSRAQIRQSLNRMLGLMDRTLGLTYPAVVSIEVRAMGDRAEFDALKEELGAPDWVEGVFVHEPPLGVVWAGSGRSRMMRVFLHESAHYMIGYGGRPRAPSWLNEGLASSFENIRFAGNALYMEPPPGHVPWLRSELAARRLVAAADVMVDDERWMDLSAERAGPRYRTSWGLTAFLLSSSPGKALLADMLARYQSTGDARTSHAAVAAGWRGGMDSLQEAWEAWIEAGPVAYQLPIPVDRDVADPQWTRCPDGRLVHASDELGCKQWVLQPDGTLVLQ